MSELYEVFLEGGTLPIAELPMDEAYLLKGWSPWLYTARPNPEGDVSELEAQVRAMLRRT